MLNEEWFLHRDIFIFDDEIVLEVTGPTEKVDRPEVLVVGGRSGVEDVLDKLPPETSLGFKSVGAKPANSHQVGSFAL